jgi:hypothetical protein
MKQVRLWISVCPFGDFKKIIMEFDDMSFGEEYWLLSSKIHNIVRSKIKKQAPYIGDFCGFLKDGETYDSVLIALYEFQKGLLPEGYLIEKLSGNYCRIFNEDNEVRVEGEYGYSKVESYFYDPVSSIITITSWEG